MLSSFPFWWLALPVLLLPVWWHRKKRQRLKAEPLATARFLPSAAPEQLRIWRWRDRVLLLVRMLLLAAVIAWLAATIFPWRGDTVLLDPGVDQAWAGRQIHAAGFEAAQRIELPASPLTWLRQHERDWRPAARLLIVAHADKIAMPARVPQFAHLVELRLKPRDAAATVPASAHTEHRIAIAAPATRTNAWHALLAAFDSADATVRYIAVGEPDAKTELIIWDQPDAVPAASWRARQWWIAPAAAARFPELASASALTINGLALKYADTPRGRLWLSPAFPPVDEDGARALYESWQALNSDPAAPVAPAASAYPAPSQTFGAARGAPPPIANPAPAPWLAAVLLALFLLERILSHARRN